MKWYIDFNQLGARQRSILVKIASEPSRTHWIQGFAGTGKTLLMLYEFNRLMSDNPEASACFITYTHALVELVNDGLRGSETWNDRIFTTKQFMDEEVYHEHVFLDEVQDMNHGDLRKIKQLSGQLIVAGDPDQNIYDDKVSHAQIRELLSPAEHKLLEIYRLTPNLLKVALSIFPTAKVVEGNTPLNKNATIRLMKYTDKENQAVGIWEEAQKRAKPGLPSVILFPNHKLIYLFAGWLASHLELGERPPMPRSPVPNTARDYGPFNDYWDRHDKNLVYLGNGYGDLSVSDNKPIVYLMTFYSSKGLDFPNVFIPFMDAGTVIGMDDEGGNKLLFVAVTRSRENLFLSYSGQIHPYLKDLPEDIVSRVEMDDDQDSPEDEEDKGEEEDEFF